MALTDIVTHTMALTNIFTRMHTTPCQPLSDVQTVGQVVRIAGHHLDACESASLDMSDGARSALARTITARLGSPFGEVTHNIVALFERDIAALDTGVALAP